MVKKLLVVIPFLCWLSSPAAAKSQEWDSWVQSARKAFKPQRVAFLTKLGSSGLPEFKTLNGHSLGFIEIVRGEQARLQFMLNDYEPKPSGHKQDSAVGKVQAMHDLLDLSAVVVAPPGKRKQWMVLSEVDGKVKKLASREAPIGSDDVDSWLMDTLGYEGVIVDRREDLLLVATLPGRLQGRSQGVVLKQSANRLIYPRDPKAGSALIELVHAAGDFGVFRVLLDGGDGSAINGGKVLLQAGD